MSYPLQYFTYQNGVLSCDGVSLVEISKKVGTPFYAYSHEAISSPVQELKQGLKGLDFEICYAVKANSNVAILKLLSSLEVGVDIVSGGELFRAGKADIPSHRVVYSGVGKSPREIEEALSYQGKGILSFNVESVPELIAIGEVATRLKRKAPVVLRFNPNVDAKTHPYISTGLQKNKFGLDKKEIYEAMKCLAKIRSIELKGLSIHIGSQILSLSVLDEAFSKSVQMFNELNQTTTMPLSIIDLGGGVGIRYKKERPSSLKEYCKLVQKHFGKSFKPKSPVRVLIEPGRSIAGNAGVLVTAVQYKKIRHKNSFVIVDAAMNDLIRPALYQSYHEIVPVLKPKGKQSLLKTNVVGPVCESADCFASNRLLPQSLQQGDLVAILSAGAYGFSMASNYNSRPKPPEVLVSNGKFEIIRERESYDDLIIGERIPHLAIQ